MRTVVHPHISEKLLLPEGAQRFLVQPFFETTGSGLAAVHFRPSLELCNEVDAPNMEHNLATWIGRNAARYRVSTRWLLMTCEAEQNLVTRKDGQEPGWGLRKLGAHDSPPPVNEGERLLRTKGGWIAVTGQWPSMAACGYAIPDRNTPCYFETEKYLGVSAQFHHAAKWLRRRIDEWNEYREKDELPQVRLVLPGGATESVICGDLPTYVSYRYTPYEREAEHRLGAEGVYMRLFRNA